MDIFIGGGGDDLAFLGLGVMADCARARARTGARVLYRPNGRLGAVRRAVARAAGRSEPVCLLGHSWGGPDAWRVAAWAGARGLPVRALVTLDPVGGPLRRRLSGRVVCPWLDVAAAPSAPDQSDRLTGLWGLARKPSGLPIAQATRRVTCDLNHWDVAGMLIASDAWRWVAAQA